MCSFPLALYFFWAAESRTTNGCMLASFNEVTMHLERDFLERESHTQTKNKSFPFQYYFKELEEQKRVRECQFQIRLGCSSTHSINMVKLFFLFFQHLHICQFWCNTWLITTNTGKHWMIWSARVSGSHQKTTTDTQSRKPDLLLYQFHCESLTETLG